MSQVKVFVTDRRRDGQRDRGTDECVLMSPRLSLKRGGQKAVSDVLYYTVYIYVKMYKKS